MSLLSYLMIPHNLLSLSLSPSREKILKYHVTLLIHCAVVYSRTQWTENTCSFLFIVCLFAAIKCTFVIDKNAFNYQYINSYIYICGILGSMIAFIRVYYMFTFVYYLVPLLLSICFFINHSFVDGTKWRFNMNFIISIDSLYVINLSYTDFHATQFEAPWTNCSLMLFDTKWDSTRVYL